MYYMIDMGYFNNNIINSEISKNKKVSYEDYIYLERDSNTKSLLKSIYVSNDDKYINTCKEADKAIGSIKIRN